MLSVSEALRDKDNRKAYALFRQIAADSAACDKYFPCFDEFAGLLTAKSSYVRTRGFCLCCAQARWDTTGKLRQALPALFPLLHDEKPTVVRQCLAALHEVALYRPELRDALRRELETIDPSRYQDSMAPLIQKDVEALLDALA